MLFLIDSAGTSSVANIIEISSSAGGGGGGGSNLVTDGGFEAVALASTGFLSVDAGNSIGPWSVVSGGVDLQEAIHRDLSAGSGAPGGQSLDLRSSSGSTVSQILSGLTPGASYTVNLSYDLHDLAGASATANLSVARLDTNFIATSVGFSAWTSDSYSFTASGTTETLSFSGLSSDGNPMTGVIIDGVSVNYWYAVINTAYG